MEGASNTASEITKAIGDVATAMGEQINMGTVAAIVAAVLGGSLVLYVGWFGIRKLIGAVQGALKGKLSV